ncbi:MAG: nitrous oxide reductase accessory protein NosL [Pedobacter sp.]|nr:nitrous oxide reductase accessory protein NosL [Pedobacter sp.]
MKSEKLTGVTKVMVGICGLALMVVLLVPLWQIELSAPQYPEGLVLKMYPHKLAGNVDIINGLNHYIGMKTLHTEDFLEFTVLPYIIVFFAVASFAVALFLKTYRWLLSLFLLFVMFGIVAMVDFWQWEYKYGHELDPNAAINVPGMSYQPPLIGYKQLLNFGAYSVPDIGGWIFIAVGALLLAAVIFQYKVNKKREKSMNGRNILATSALLVTFSLASCTIAPQAIKVGKDACSFCKMGVADKRFGAEIITKKGKIYKFDDLHCLNEFKKTGAIKKEAIQATYVVDFEEPNDFIELKKAFFFKNDVLRSPMGSNVSAFSSEQALKAHSEVFDGEMGQLNTLVLDK